MSDRRLTPNPDWATGETPARICLPVVDLLARPHGPRDRQLLMGEAVTILGQREDTAHIRAEKDGYHGFVNAAALGPESQPTHKISAPASHAYAEPDLKSPDRLSLSFASRVAVIATSGDFCETEYGHIPAQHLRPIDSLETDPAAVAERFIGTPYLWGGNSRFGIDCSGLVQAAFLACGHPCPGDSDLQAADLGEALPDGTPYLRNDLLFWKGHVALVLTPKTLIHANAHAMAVAVEGIDAAIARIASQGDGPVTAHRRL
ncbi:NlpC/P60 family protein [Shimia sp. FJ5]|uniref:C40 family peptidase n=1 Tax=Shimia sp. FJ5 TaxID=3079054 RepID=UPI0026367F22|nr:NlpC/P60 family protein [Shimia sp. FJ5]MDV4143307.1 NlpC/P60 family protein [Shimia sp. FJ5]